MQDAKPESSSVLSTISCMGRSNFGGLLLAFRRLVKYIKSLEYLLKLFNYDLDLHDRDKNFTKRTIKIEKSMEAAIPL
jgi:hypothetical protein